MWPSQGPLPASRGSVSASTRCPGRPARIAPAVRDSPSLSPGGMCLLRVTAPAVRRVRVAPNCCPASGHGSRLSSQAGSSPFSSLLGSPRASPTQVGCRLPGQWFGVESVQLHHGTREGRVGHRVSSMAHARCWVAFPLPRQIFHNRHLRIKMPRTSFLL